LSDFPQISSFNTIIFDFDGIFTNNLVYVDQHGIESVACSRADGLAINILMKYRKLNDLCLDCFILSSEANSVVSSRGNKLSLPVRQSVSDKLTYVKDYLAQKGKKFKELIYLGNDLNDYHVMQNAGFTVAPADSHPLILKIADQVLPVKGGQGFVRFFVERMLKLDEMSSDELAKLL
jgi:3-deoxy-D-manno-octulosonate 8-phosphate phosphatase (KDO 8-P phosphatase)